MTISAEAMCQLESRGLDVELADRMGWASTQRGGRELIVIPFYRGDKLMRSKVRNITGDKYFSQLVPGGAQTCWNENVLHDDSLIDLPLIITEGEFDAMTAIQCGFRRTISVPNGAPAPRKEGDGPMENDGRYEWVRDAAPLISRDRCKEIIIASDGDDNGAQMLHDLSLKFQRLRCKFLTYPYRKAPDENARCKDLNEVLQVWGHKGVVQTINGASWITVNGVFRLSELPPVPTPLKFDIGFPLLGENYKMRLGDLAVITGVPGLGKTTFVNDLCCRVAHQHHLKIAWASFEQMPQRDHRRSLRTWFNERPVWQQTDEEIEAADDWIDEHHMFVVPDDGDDVTLDWLLDRIEVAVVQRGANVIVIDPWNEMDHEREGGETMTEYVGRAIKTFRRLARKLQVHLIVVAHPAKLQKVEGKYKPPTLYDISDSANWYNKCDIGIIVHREDEQYTDIKVQKSRYHDEIGTPGEVRMMFCKDDRRFREAERLA
jgi:twinkle protein